jgi:hypothetical protein
MWNACTSEPSVAFRWFECHPGSAVWIQAMLTVVVIAIAILGPILQIRFEHVRRSAERLSRSQNLISSLIGDVFPFVAEVLLLERDLNSDVGGPPGNLPDWTRWFNAARLQIPDSLRLAVPMTHDMEESVVRPLRDLVSTSTAYNAYLRLFEEFDPTIADSVWTESRNHIRSNISLVSLAADEATKLYASKSAHELVPSLAVRDSLRWRAS